MHQLSREVKEQFAEVRERFAGIDQRFERVDREFVAVRAEITRQAEATRRHFDVVAEQLKAGHELLAGGIANLTRQAGDSWGKHTVIRVLDDHELRLKALERDAAGETS